jgi:light-regulated signal transduction histidine kinase (bacteriophytochrome)
LADVDVVTGLEHGGDNYLREPVDPSVLVATVRALLRVKDVEEALVRSNEQLRRFAFVVSHELQEPLRMVKSYTQLLAQKYRGTLSEEANEFIGFTVSGVSRMEKFIQDMLAYSQAAEAEMDMKPFSCQTALDWAMLELGAGDSRKSREGHVRVAPGGVGRPDAAVAGVQEPDGNAIKYRADRAP